MEFETKTTDASPEISDMQRLAASTKRVAITPIHSNLTAEPVSDEDVEDVHVGDGLIPTISADTEDTSTYTATPTVAAPDAKPDRKTLLFSVGIVLVLGLVVALAFYLRT